MNGSAERSSLSWRRTDQITSTDGESDIVWVEFDGKIFGQQWRRRSGLVKKVVGSEGRAGVALAEEGISGNKLNGGEIQEMINRTEGAAAK